MYRDNSFLWLDGTSIRAVDSAAATAFAAPFVCCLLFLRVIVAAASAWETLLLPCSYCVEGGKFRNTMFLL
jgi:hypothetical protein